MNFFYLEEIDSTNKYVKDNMTNLEHMTVVYTSKQTCGRGRLNRKWNDLGCDNIYATIVLKPSDRMCEKYSNLTQLLAVVLAETLEGYNVNPKIKWPNDIRINQKKISGILAEGVLHSNGHLDGLALGFGVNLNCEPEALKEINQAATSLNIETGKFIDKNIFLKKITDRFCLLYNKFIEEGFLSIRNDYIRRAEFFEHEITVKVLDKIYQGKAIDVTEDGALVIVDNNNNKHTLLIGDIL